MSQYNVFRRCRAVAPRLHGRRARGQLECAAAALWGGFADRHQNVNPHQGLKRAPSVSARPRGQRGRAEPEGGETQSQNAKL